MSKELKTNEYDIQLVSIFDIKPYKNNARQVNQTAINQVKKSIQQNGFTNVIIVDKNMEIIAGHTRLEAAKQLNMMELPVFIAKDLDDEQARRLRLLDNRLVELTPWDIEKLVQEIEATELDDDIEALFEPLMNEDLSEFDLSDDTYTPEEPTYNQAIIQYVMIFVNERQQSLWYSFLSSMQEMYPDEETHAARLEKFIESKSWAK